jgi:hypothetical protein
METVQGIAEFLGISIQPLLFTFVVELAFVYIFGRMLLLVFNPRYKNLIAIASGLPAAYIGVIGFTWKFTLLQMQSAIFVYCLSIILYVLFGFRLFTRINSLQDKTIADDKITDVPEDVDPILM